MLCQIPFFSASISLRFFLVYLIPLLHIFCFAIVILRLQQKPPSPTEIGVTKLQSLISPRLPPTILSSALSQYHQAIGLQIEAFFKSNHLLLYGAVFCYEKQVTNPAVKKWLDKLRDAVFEVEDLFDEINTEALLCQVEAESPSPSQNIGA
ncbi:hypothetical protein RJT34_27469 [Clitoria ternatea]|uniref:Disease resistance N-terminal domain-containing protein n=1 Tax=Clitoria ternatea TaxID=43366 RepID=A0AAN9I8J2_CLITE